MNLRKELLKSKESNKVLFQELVNYILCCRDIRISNINNGITERGLSIRDNDFITYFESEHKIRVYKDDKEQFEFNENSPILDLLESFILDLCNEAENESDIEFKTEGSLISYPYEQVHEAFRKIVDILITLDPDEYLKGNRALTFASEITLYLQSQDCSLGEIKDVIEVLEKASPILHSIKTIENSKKISMINGEGEFYVR